MLAVNRLYISCHVHHSNEDMRCFKKLDSIPARMLHEYKEGNNDCRPNEVAFITAMGAWERSGRSDAFDGALRLFLSRRK
jgi:hypothetical protein